MKFEMLSPALSRQTTDEVNYNLDELTGLLRFQEFQRSCADTEFFGSLHGVALVIFVDADNLKLINDSLGHNVGDGLIIKISEILSRYLPPGTLVCRKGGDEFVAALSCKDRLEAEGILHELITALRGSQMICDHEILLSCSVGASIEPVGTASLQEQCQAADIAMYWAKQSGKNQFKIFDKVDCADFEMMHALSIQFPSALERGDLSIAFQPIYSMGVRSSAILGAEALVRWEHADYGAIPAEKIVLLASKSGRIRDLGEFVVRTACSAATEWSDDMYVCVNFSAADFLRVDFSASISSILKEVNLSPRRLRIEITESEVLELNETVMRNLSLLRRCGIKIGVDDFGTGHSSMGNIDGFPADFVKIDRSLICGCDHRISSKIFIKAIKAVADKVGFELIAEGVETLEEVAVVRGAGISAAQGYYFCRPLVSADAQLSFPPKARPLHWQREGEMAWRGSDTRTKAC